MSLRALWTGLLSSVKYILLRREISSGTTAKLFEKIPVRTSLNSSLFTLLFFCPSYTTGTSRQFSLVLSSTPRLKIEHNLGITWRLNCARSPDDGDRLPADPANFVLHVSWPALRNGNRYENSSWALAEEPQLVIVNQDQCFETQLFCKPRLIYDSKLVNF